MKHRKYRQRPFRCDVEKCWIESDRQTENWWKDDNTGWKSKKYNERNIEKLLKIVSRIIKKNCTYHLIITERGIDWQNF